MTYYVAGSKHSPFMLFENTPAYKCLNRYFALKILNYRRADFSYQTTCG